MQKHLKLYLGVSDILKTPYYVFDANAFIDNYLELKNEFQSFYPNYNIAYSFKTNYTPAVCKIVHELGGYAEVVSDMEYELAKKMGFPIEHIIYNGPGKEECFADCILGGGLLNIDNDAEVEKVCNLSGLEHDISVGIRVNFDIGNGLHSRFGIDVLSGRFEDVVFRLLDNGIRIKGLHFHISRARGLEAWKKRIDTMLSIADKIEDLQREYLEYLDIGSGMFGKLDKVLKEQFQNVPSYHEYAEIVAGAMSDHYSNRVIKPMLFTEPGTTLVSKYFTLYATILDIKTIREKTFALLDCSFHNVGEICGLKKVPMRVMKKTDQQKEYTKVDFVGYTCLEQDVMYRDYCGSLGVGDVIEFNNVGGYSIVDKPPFIHPDIPIYMDKDEKRICVKRAQTLEDIFAPYVF